MYTCHESYIPPSSHLWCQNPYLCTFPFYAFPSGFQELVSSGSSGNFPAKAEPWDASVALPSLSSQETHQASILWPASSSFEPRGIERGRLCSWLLNISLQSHLLLDSCHLTVLLTMRSHLGICSAVRLSLGCFLLIPLPSQRVVHPLNPEKTHEQYLLSFTWGIVNQLLRNKSSETGDGCLKPPCSLLPGLGVFWSLLKRMLTCCIGFPLFGKLSVVKCPDMVSPALSSSLLFCEGMAKTFSYLWYLISSAWPLQFTLHIACCLREFSKSFWGFFCESKICTMTFSGLYHWSFTYTSNLMFPLLDDSSRPLYWRFQLAVMSFPFPGHSSGAFLIILQNSQVSSYLLNVIFYDYPLIP